MRTWAKQTSKMPRRSAANDEPRAGTLDMLQSRSSAVRKRLGVDNVTIEYIEASGDCFYLAMEAALSENDGWCPYYAVGTMREVVASSMTEETYQMYALMHREKADGTCTHLEVRNRGWRLRGGVRASRRRERRARRPAFFGARP